MVDSGIRISQVDQSESFEAHGKLPHSENENLEGTGMGLAISKRIIYESGGTIDVFSLG